MSYVKPPTVGQTVAFAMQAHGDQRDLSGYPYILHSLRVMLAMPRDAPHLMRIAVLHDVIEDTDVVAAKLIALGLPAAEVDTVLALTRFKGTETYEAYLRRLKAAGPWAVQVKLADLADNLRPERMTMNTASRASRYAKALAFLKEEP